MSTKYLKLHLSLLVLIGLVLLSLVPASFTAAQDGDDSAQPAETAETSPNQIIPVPTDDPAETPADEPVETPTEEATEAPVDDPTGQPTDEPTEEATEPPVEAPSETPVDDPTGQPSPTPEIPVDVFTADFQNGSTAGWVLSGDWQLAAEDDNLFLTAAMPGSTALVRGVDWPDFLFAAQVRLAEGGALWVNLRDGLSISLDSTGQASLLRGGSVIASGAAVPAEPGGWRLLNIQALGESIIVAVDRVAQFSHSDPALWGAGALSFSVAPGSSGAVALDDVIINRLDAPEITPTPEPEPTLEPEPTTEPTEVPTGKSAARAADAGIPTDLWAVILEPGVNPAQTAAQNGFEYVGPVGQLANTYLFRLPGSDAQMARAQSGASSLRSARSVTWFQQQIAYQHSTRQTVIDNSPRPLPGGTAARVPGDPLFNDQWHLLNTGQFGGLRGIDANVVSAWDDLGYTGAGVVIAIVDDGLQYTHPDLAANYVPGGSYDFNFDDADPAPDPTWDPHGTAAGGVAAARDNATCGVGAAYRAGLSGIRLIALPSTDAMDAAALNYQWNINHIYNNSWGPADTGFARGPGPLTAAALLNGVTSGRGGLGSIFVWAGGNGRQNNDNVNADGYANSRYTIAVGAIDNRGRQSWYSEPGAALFISAPSSGDSVGITTTDLLGDFGYNGYTDNLDCTNEYGGTSSASPLVAGVVALMLEANPSLHWRDVQHILARTATRNHAGDGDWRRNQGGFFTNHKYGFGLVNATGAVRMARQWQNMPEPQTYSSGTIVVNRAIPDNNATGISTTFDVSGLPANFVLEHVEVIFNATHTWRGDLRVELTGPSGMRSLLINQRLGDNGSNYNNWRFMTVRHWGETRANGRWRLQVSDRFAQDTGTLNSWELVLHGYLRPAVPAGRPTLTAPAHNSFTNDNTPVFTWTAVNNATSYDVEIATDARFRNIVVAGTVPSLDATLLLPIADGRYFWRVRGRNINEYAPWSATRSFTVDTIAPDTPVLRAPIDGAVVNQVRPPLRWYRALPDTRTYRVQIATDAIFDDIVLDVDGIRSVTYRLRQSLGQGLHYWRVAAVDRAGNQSPWSDTESFVVNISRVPRHNQFLVTRTDTRPSFTWSRVPEGISYRLEVATDAGFDLDTIYTFETNRLSHRLPVDAALTEGRYMWRVLVDTGSGFTPISSAVSSNFAVTPPAPPRVTLAGPANGTTLPFNGGDVELSWNPVTYTLTPFSYVVEVADNSRFRDAQVFPAGGDTSIIVNLTPGRWFWRVRALNIYDFPGAYSAGRSFILSAP